MIAQPCWICIGIFEPQRRVRDDDTNPVINALRLAGIVSMLEGYLWVRNRIYFRVFDQDWIIANMPDAELPRQKVAFRRGMIRAGTLAAVSSLVCLVVYIGISIIMFWSMLRTIQPLLNGGEAARCW